MRTVQRSALCRSWRDLSNEYLLAKIGVDTAENEPPEVWGKIQFIIHLPPRPRRVSSAIQADGRRHDGRSAKFRQNVARFRLYRHRFLQENTRFAAFFKIYQIR